jgi:acyl carrier protein
MSVVDLDVIQRALGEHIESEILLRRTPLAPDEDLIEAGFDSMSLTRTLVFLEDRFGVKIPDEEVVLDELSTLEKLARFVHGRMAQAKR